MSPVEIDSLSDWVPFALSVQEGAASVDWCPREDGRFREPFFDQTAARLSRFRPRRRTSLDELRQFGSTHPGIPPTAFLFHLSRCGSTLVAQMLASDPSFVVLSEARLLESVLRLPGDRETTFRATVNALAQPRPGQNRLFIKFSSRAIDELPLIRRTFPDVPWIFLYREPMEVMAALLAGGAQALPPGLAASGLLAGDPEAVAALTPVEFWAKVLASRCATALANLGSGRNLLLNYEQLPKAVWTVLPGFLGIEFSANDIGRMVEVAGRNAKNPARAFSSDSERKRAAATPEMRAAAAEVAVLYRELEARRAAASTIPGRQAGCFP